MRKVFAILFLLITMTACTAETEIETSSQKQDEKKAEEKSDTGVVQEDLSASLVEEESETEGKDFIYEVKNNTDKDIEIPFNQNGGHGYVVRDESGKELTRQDGYGTIQSNQVVSPGEAITIKIGLGGYEKGTYELEVWMESGLENSFNQTILFIIE
ncbi:BsuPI-related putative proteinase inhibitor [Mesobacillus jeotgali]|uniref:Intracellular proteinase inhibitor BsuPI domain-containing protein n=1 Tax=Mesobacillus jeotgali TaxID=129985 RepID=A0ABY9VMT7_9BACI|nr:BsuPI-related putative proteinase inhibitor [Mesobacillus jeotgali]WNF24960.1 BsuPI-related putative proteinase inhibitor [Mesobacillus jeotgali]